MLLVGSGARSGREGAPRQFAAALGDLGTSRWALTPRDREILLACAAGAGLGAVYSVPVGGALFAARILLGSWHPRVLGTALITRAWRSRWPRRSPIWTRPLHWPDPSLSYLFVGIGAASSRRWRLAVGLAFNKLMALARPASRSLVDC